MGWRARWRRWRLLRLFQVRWTFLLALFLVFLKASSAGKGAVRLAAYLLALMSHELMHWLIAWRLFPGLEWRLVLAPLGGPAPVPRLPPGRSVIAALAPALAGALIGGGILWRTWAQVQGTGGFWERSLGFFVLVSAANLLPFYPLDGHAWMNSIVRGSRFHWRYPAWREYAGVLGGVVVALAAILDPLGAGELAFSGGVSMVAENVYLLRLRHRDDAARGVLRAKRAGAAEHKRLDEILEHVGREGLGAISPSEREFLKEMGRRFRQRN